MIPYLSVLSFGSLSWFTFKFIRSCLKYFSHFHGVPSSSVQSKISMWCKWCYDVLTCIWKMALYKSNHSELFLGKGVLKICDIFTGEHSWRSAISIKFIEIKLRLGCSAVNLPHVFSEHLSLRAPLDGCFCLYKVVPAYTNFLEIISLYLISLSI